MKSLRPYLSLHAPNKRRADQLGGKKCADDQTAERVGDFIYILRAGNDAEWMIGIACSVVNRVEIKLNIFAHCAGSGTQKQTAGDERNERTN